MALRQGGRALARSIMQAKALPERGAGGGPVKYAPPPNKPLPLYDELWWDDGLYHSQPVLDGTLTQMPQTPGSYVRQLGGVLAAIGGLIWAFNATWNDSKVIAGPVQYPPETVNAFASRGKMEFDGPPPPGIETPAVGPKQYI